MALIALVRGAKKKLPQAPHSVHRPGLGYDHMPAAVAVQGDRVGYVDGPCGLCLFTTARELLQVISMTPDSRLQTPG